ncbi:hypothetical protein ACFW04_005892 [Cataglyphis niger]
MCALCLASLAMSGVLFYRELNLESRIASLEAHCLRIEESSSPVDVLVQRLKSEVQEQLRQTQQFAPVDIFRPKREVSEARCNCPAAKGQNAKSQKRQKKLGAPSLSGALISPVNIPFA